MKWRRTQNLPGQRHSGQEAGDIAQKDIQAEGTACAKSLLERRALCLPAMSSSPCGWKGQGGKGKDHGRRGQGPRHAGPSALAQEIDSSCRRREARESGQQRGSAVSSFESELRQGAVGRSGLRPTGASP